MKLGRNQLCPCGSGLKFKKCCRVPAVVIENTGLVVPASVVDDVVNAIAAMSDEDLGDRLQDLALTQRDLCAFITPLSNALPEEASFQAALAGFAIVWMFQQHHQHRLPQVTAVDIQRCLDNNGRSFLDFDDFRDRRLHVRQGSTFHPQIHCRHHSRFRPERLRLRCLRPVQPPYDAQNYGERSARSYIQGRPRKTSDCLIGCSPLVDSRPATVNLRSCTSAAAVVPSVLAFSPHFCAGK
jgi:hypothetical protein